MLLSPEKLATFRHSYLCPHDLIFQRSSSRHCRCYNPRVRMDMTKAEVSENRFISSDEAIELLLTTVQIHPQNGAPHSSRVGLARVMIVQYPFSGCLWSSGTDGSHSSFFDRQDFESPDGIVDVEGRDSRSMDHPLINTHTAHMRGCAKEACGRFFI